MAHKYEDVWQEGRDGMYNKTDFVPGRVVLHPNILASIS